MDARMAMTPFGEGPSVPRKLVRSAYCLEDEILCKISCGKGDERKDVLKDLVCVCSIETGCGSRRAWAGEVPHRCPTRCTRRASQLCTEYSPPLSPSSDRWARRVWWACPPTSTRRSESEWHFNPPSALLVLRSHRVAMLVYHVSLQVHRGWEYDEFLFEASGVLTWVMFFLEVHFELFPGVETSVLRAFLGCHVRY